MTRLDDGIYAAMARRGVSRRTFIKFSAAMAAALALPAGYAPRIAAAVAAAPRLPVVWLRGQTCSGNTATFLRATNPTVSELLLDLVSLDYHEQLMAPAGAAAEQSRADAVSKSPHGYLLVVEGAIPTGDDGVYCMVGGRPLQEIVREMSAGALATIAVGSCAFDGGAPSANGGPTGAVGAASVVSGGVLVNLPGCPLNVDNLVATVVHYLTFKEFPATDMRGRPLFAYGGLVHNQCERRAHFEFGEFVTAWGDEGSQKGWCLYKLGCKGPETYANCPTQRYADGTSWAVKAGHGCIGCTMPRFLDAYSPFYHRLPDPVPLFPSVSADTIGQVLVGGVVGVTMLHGSIAFARSQVGGPLARRRAGRAARAAGAGDAGAAGATGGAAARTTVGDAARATVGDAARTTVGALVPAEPAAGQVAVAVAAPPQGRWGGRGANAGTVRVRGACGGRGASCAASAAPVSAAPVSAPPMSEPPAPTSPPRRRDAPRGGSLTWPAR